MLEHLVKPGGRRRLEEGEVASLAMRAGGLPRLSTSGKFDDSALANLGFGASHSMDAIYA